MLKAKTGFTRGKFVLVLAVVLLIAVAGTLAGTNYTSAKYVLRDDRTLSVTVFESEVFADVFDTVEWLYDQIFDTTTNTGTYWKTRINTNGNSLDSTGGNWGVKVCQDIKDHFNLPEINFSFRMYVYRKTVNGTATSFFNIFFVNTYIGDLSTSAIVEDVYMFCSETDEWTVGTIGLNSKYVTVNGVNQYMNCMVGETYVVQQTVVRP